MILHRIPAILIYRNCLPQAENKADMQSGETLPHGKNIMKLDHKDKSAGITRYFPRVPYPNMIQCRVTKHVKPMAFWQCQNNASDTAPKKMVTSSFARHCFQEDSQLWKGCSRISRIWMASPRFSENPGSRAQTFWRHDIQWLLGQMSRCF